MISPDRRRTLLRARHRLTRRAVGPVRHALDERLAPLEQRLARIEASAAAPPAPEPGLSGSLLHHALRTAEVARMPRDGVRTLLSAGCAGRWYFDWIAEHYGPVERHIGVEWYTPKPDDLPPGVEWIRNTVGDMSDVGDGEADLVFSGQNLEHLSADDVVAFLVEAHRVLRPGGHLAIDSPNRLVTARLQWTHPEHTIELAPSEAADLVRLAGFDVRTVRGMWRCVSTMDGSTLPIEASDPAEQIQRTQSGVDDPDDCFLWWLEAERGAREPDRDGLRARLEEIYAEAWPERCNRLRSEIGTVVDRDGVPWVEVPAGSAGAAVCGPPAALVPGRWTVGFAVEPRDGERGLVCRIVVKTIEGEVLAEATPTAEDLGPGGAVELQLETGPGFTMGVEFRVEAIEGRPAFAARRRVSVQRQ